MLDQRNVSPLEAYDKWRAWADEKVCCDYGFHVGITWWSEKVAKDMEVLVKDKGRFSEKLCALCVIIYSELSDSDTPPRAERAEL